MPAYGHRLPASVPDDTTALVAAIDAGTIDPTCIVAILGKTEGNGCVNDGDDPIAIVACGREG